MPATKRGASTKIERPVAAKPKKRARSKVRKYSGLCSTCSNAPACTYRREFGEPKLFCDEFEGGLAMQKKSDDEETVSPAHPRSKSREEERDTGREVGLCGHCENREFCTYPKPEGGVWHCDEYK